jgi:hypothetical protein
MRSNTIEKQTSRFNPPALTMVVILELNHKKQFDLVLDEIANLGYKISRTNRLHCTLLGLFPNSQTLLTPNVEQLVTKNIFEFIDDWKSRGNQIIFDLNFKRIRPGNWLDRHQELFDSDGTIVAIGELEKDSDNDRFDMLGKDLANFLISKIPKVVGSGLGRKYPTNWCTLGYFRTRDFILNKKFVDMFDKWKSLTDIIPPVRITKLELVKTPYRSLEGSKTICEFS